MSAARSGFGATLRFEVVSDEGRPLFVSYLVASLLALSWLGLVRMMPIPLADIPPVIELPDHHLCSGGAGSRFAVGRCREGAGSGVIA